MEYKPDILCEIVKVVKRLERVYCCISNVVFQGVISNSNETVADI